MFKKVTMEIEEAQTLTKVRWYQLLKRNLCHLTYLTTWKVGKMILKYVPKYFGMKLMTQLHNGVITDTAKTVLHRRYIPHKSFIIVTIQRCCCKACGYLQMS